MAVNRAEFGDGKASISQSETNQADDRGMLLCAKKGLHKVIPMFSNKMFSNSQGSGGGGEDLESNGLSILQSENSS